IRGPDAPPRGAERASSGLSAGHGKSVRVFACFLPVRGPLASRLEPTDLVATVVARCFPSVGPEPLVGRLPGGLAGPRRLERRPPPPRRPPALVARANGEGRSGAP